MKDKKIRELVIAAMFAALTCVATLSIRIPTPATSGYVNVGDTVVLLSAWMLGGSYGALAAGIGSGLADLLSGYSYYVPGTFLIKFLMAFAASLLLSFLAKKKIWKTAGYLISAVVSELIMVFGYFLYASLILGRGLSAAASIGGNIAQGATCGILALVCIAALNVPGRLISRSEWNIGGKG